MYSLTLVRTLVSTCIKPIGEFMSKLLLSEVPNGVSNIVTNTNFGKIEKELNDNTLKRRTEVGEDNAVHTDIDMNSHRIYNLPKPVRDHEPLRLAEMGEIKKYTEEAKDWAEKSQGAYENTLEALTEGSEYIGNYGPGLVIEAYTNFFGRDGIWWRPTPDLELPYTTTGDWGEEESLFVEVGVQTLRKDLANPNKGAAMIRRGVVAVDSIADLLSLPEEQRREDLRYLVKGYHAGSDVGGGEFYWDAYSTATPDNGIVFSVAGASTGRFHRIVYNNTVSFSDFGCKADGSDETALMQAALNAPYNITSARDQTYTTSATLFNQVPNRTVDFNWSRIRNKTNSRYAIVTVSEALLNQTDAALSAFWAELHYNEQIENSHIKNVLVDMQPNTGGGANLGIGIVYGRGCTLEGFVIENTNGNGYEIKHSRDCHASHGQVFGARSYGSFNYMTKDCSSVNVHIKGVQRAGIVKHAYYDDPNVNYTFEKCVFESIRLKGVAGGSSAQTGTSPAQEPIGHEIVRGVKVLDCDFITRVGDGVVSSVEPGGHADSWVIKGNRFYVPVGHNASGFAINMGGELSAGFSIGGQHVLAGNKFFGGDYIDAVVTASTSVLATDNEFHDVQGLRAFILGFNRDGGRSSIRGTKGTFKLTGGGGTITSGGFITIRGESVRPEISASTLDITGVVRTPGSSRKTLAFVVAEPASKAKVHGNNITINLSGLELERVHAIVASDGHVSGNTITVNNSVSGATIYGVLATEGGGVLCGDNDLILNDTRGDAISRAIRAAAGSVIGTNRYTGWAIDEQILS